MEHHECRRKKRSPPPRPTVNNERNVGPATPSWWLLEETRLACHCDRIAGTRAKHVWSLSLDGDVFTVPMHFKQSQFTESRRNEFARIKNGRETSFRRVTKKAFNPQSTQLHTEVLPKSKHCQAKQASPTHGTSRNQGAPLQTPLQHKNLTQRPIKRNPQKKNELRAVRTTSEGEGKRLGRNRHDAEFVKELQASDGKRSWQVTPGGALKPACASRAPASQSSPQCSCPSSSAPSSWPCPHGAHAPSASR